MGIAKDIYKAQFLKISVAEAFVENQILKLITYKHSQLQYNLQPRMSNFEISK